MGDISGCWRSFSDQIGRSTLSRHRASRSEIKKIGKSRSKTRTVREDAKMSEKRVKNDDFGPQKIPPNCAFDPDRGRYLPWNHFWYGAPGLVCLCRIWNQVANASGLHDQVRTSRTKKSEKIVKMRTKNVHSKGCKKRRISEA